MKKLTALFLIALLIRLALILTWYQSGNGHRISADGMGYYSLAKSFNEGKGFQFGGVLQARRPPLYPIFIAFLLRFSPFPLGVHLAQAWVGALSCVILFGVGREMFGRRTGFAASAMMALDYASVRQTVSVMTETLFVFFLFLSFYCLIRAQKEKKTTWLIGAGIFSGISLLVRDVFIYYYPCIILWFFLWQGEPWKKRFAWAGTFVLVLFLVIAPWIFRNSLLFKRPILITIGQEAYTFYLANNPYTSGGRTGGDWELGADAYPPQEPDLAPQGSITPESERYLYRKSFDFIRSQPGKFIALIGRKIVNMWRPYQTDSPLLARWAMALTYLPVVLLGLWGMIRGASRWREFFPIFMAIAYIFSFHAILIAHMRYRFPVMPFFMVFAAWTLLAIWENACAKKKVLGPSVH